MKGLLENGIWKDLGAHVQSVGAEGCKTRLGREAGEPCQGDPSKLQQGLEMLSQVKLTVTGEF